MKYLKYKPEALQASAWQAALKKVRHQQTEVVPPEWMTVNQIGDVLGICSKTADIKVKTLLKQGLAEKKEFKVIWGQQIRLRPHYRLVTPPARDRKRG